MHHVDIMMNNDDDKTNEGTSSKNKMYEGKYQILDKIGKGVYGSVFRGIDLKNNVTVAIKRFRVHQKELGLQSTTLREVSFLKGLNHPNIVRVHEILSDVNNVSMVLEYMSMDLATCIESLITPMSKKRVVLLFKQLLRGVDEVHSHKIIHRDIKPANILVDNDVLKLGDFGMARSISEPARPYSTDVTTVYYRSPEMALLGGVYGYESDIWSCGCILFEMITGNPFIKADGDLQLIHKIFGVFGSPSEQDWPELWEKEGYVSILKDYIPYRKKSVKQMFINMGIDEDLSSLLEVSRSNPR